MKLTSEKDRNSVRKLCSAFLNADRDTQLRLEGIAEGILLCRTSSVKVEKK